MIETSHIGRFAPSPTGPLHAGSLVAALGSYLCARKNEGSWLVRIEDLDPPREQPGASDIILRSLEAHSLFWDDEVVFQSQQHQRYQEAIDHLLDSGVAYYCECSRKEIFAAAKPGNYGPIYPGTCRDNGLPHGAVRLRTDNHTIGFTDARIGIYQQQLESELGDFVIQRRDTLFAYQLAVVLDDAREKITDIVRGIDLLDNTPRQIYLQQVLGLPTPSYLHLPLVRNEQGQKLSKQNLAPQLDNSHAGPNLIQALTFLGFNTSELAQRSTTFEILEWALAEADWSETSIAAYAG